MLEHLFRVRVVHATPGSGKTWLVAELIRQELGKWPSKTSGIAALSFTRVGGDEIRKAIGYELCHPHFVGTIDAFLFRYVIRPFLQYCFPSFANPHLIPGEWGATHWGKYGLKQSSNVGKGINLFGCVFIDEVQGEEVVAYKRHPSQPLQRLSEIERRQVIAGKNIIWERSGGITHSDAALLSSKILAHPTFGSAVRLEIARRFPLVIVDELQDTGYFLGKCIHLLLTESAVRGVLVGDPDQAIFEFNGARPDLFSDFETIDGAVSLPLANSRRCPRAVAQAAQNIRDSGGVIGPAEDRRGRAIIVSYTELKTDIERIVKAIMIRRAGQNVKVIARSNHTIETLSGKNSETPPKLRCPALNHITRSVIAFRQDRNVAALAAARAAIDIAVFEHEGVDDDVLNQHGIDPGEWKILAVRCLLKANALSTADSIFDWQKTASEILDAELSAFTRSHPSITFTSGRLKPKKANKWETPSAKYLPQLNMTEQNSTAVPAQTVHSVKGETHDTTIFVCPASKANHCPSVIWWSPDVMHREEKRIAYVAMTRTCGDLVLCIPVSCYDRLTASRPQFVADFECFSVDEFVHVIS